MKKNLLMRFRSIRTSIIFSFAVLIVFALMVFLLLSLNFTREAVLENSTEYTSQLIGQVNNDIDSYIGYMENISLIVADNSDVWDYLFGRELSREREEELPERILGVFKTITDTRSDIVNIALLSRNRAALINQGRARLNPYIDVSELTWYQAAVAAGEKTVISSSHVQNAIYGSYDWVVTLSRNISRTEDPEAGGVFFVDLNYSAISDLCERISLGNRGYIYILDENGGIVYHPQQQLIYSGMKKELIDEVMQSKESSFLTKDGRLYTISRSERTGWIVVGVSMVSELMRRAEEARKIYLLIALALFMAALVLAYLLSDEITKPIKALEKSMKEVEKGNFAHAALAVREENEIGHLSRNFNMMTEEIQNLIEQRDQEQQIKRKSELKALQSQINPHFLYNTLDSIIWMAEWGKNQEVVRMTSSLAKLLRRSISNEQETVTVAEEVEYTETYLTIQKMRYKDKLEYEIQVEPEILQENVIKLILQPLVENAIYHGIKYKEGKGLVRVEGFREGEHMILRVRDDGKGMDSETLAHIFEKHTRDTRSNGVGLNNVNERIQIYYGEDYGISFKSSQGKGTEAVITLPFGKEEGSDEES